MPGRPLNFCQSPVILSSASTASDGCAPTPSQYCARSEVTSIRGLLLRVVLADLLDDLAVALLARVDDDDAVVRRPDLAHALQTDLDGHECGVSSDVREWVSGPDPVGTRSSLAARCRARPDERVRARRTQPVILPDRRRRRKSADTPCLPPRPPVVRCAHVRRTGVPMPQQPSGRGVHTTRTGDGAAAADRAAPVALPAGRARPPGPTSRSPGLTSGTRWASGARRTPALPVRVKQHGSLLLRELGRDEMALQHNKVTNLRLASARVDGVLIRPGETFSFNKVVGNCTRRKGYVDGMRLSNGEARGRRRRRHLPAGQPAALDVPALAADRGRALGAQLRPVPGQRPGAALGRRLLDRLQLRRPGGPQRHRRRPSSCAPGSATGTCDGELRADRRLAALLPGRGARRAVPARTRAGSSAATRSGGP